MLNTADVSERLKSLRSTLSVTQKKLSEVLNCSQGKVSDYESGKLSISNSDLFTIANTYNIDLNWLITGFGSMFNNVRARESGNSSKHVITLPVVADIACGTGIEAYDIEPTEHINLDRSLISLPGPYLCFKVAGDSMAPYIMDRDYAIVTQSWADLDFNDHICAFRTLEGLVLKRFYIPTSRRSALLIPLNPTYPVIKYTQDSAEYTLIGLLVTVIRKYI
jgi:SOS-response transcriptional repressor LexA